VIHIRVGVPDFLSVRPLILGLTRRQAPEVELVYNQPGLLAEALTRGDLDAALVPSIEYLRGVGNHYLDGPALVAKPGAGSLLLLAQRPVESLERIAVSEYCRSPVSATRIVLAEKFGVIPDLCVCKNMQGDWREEYDGILLTGDQGLQFLTERPDSGVTVHNVTAMWEELTSLPLVRCLWVYDEEALSGQLTKVMVLSRNLGLQNLSRLADGVARTTQFEGEVIYDYLSNCWDYHLTEKVVEGLRVFEEYALRYDLIRHARLDHVATG
jgi:chorismate dehydratase